MGDEGFRRAPMMHEKLTTLTRTYLNPKPHRRRYIIENKKDEKELPAKASNSK
jgi:hypothetical protein